MTDVIYSGSDFHLPDLTDINFVRCRVCGLMYLKPRPALNEMGAFYPEDYEPYQHAIEDEKLDLMRWLRREKMVKRRTNDRALQQQDQRLNSGCRLRHRHFLTRNGAIRLAGSRHRTGSFRRDVRPSAFWFTGVRRNPRYPSLSPGLLRCRLILGCFWNIPTSLPPSFSANNYIIATRRPGCH